MIWAILVLGTLLRLVNLNQSLWLDEAAQALMSQKSLYSIIFERSGDFHPPLSYIMYHFWEMAGTSEIWLRLPSIIFGVATILVIYKLCQKLFTEKVALISALFLGVAPYHVYYSQEIRMYSMAAFIATVSMYYLVSKSRIGYVISSSALIYTHYMGFFFLASQLLYKRDWKLLGLVLLTYLPWLPFLWNQLQNGIKADEYLLGWGKLLSIEPIKAIPLTFIKFSIGRINFESLYLYGIVAAVTLTFLGFLLFKAWVKESKLIWYWLSLPILLSWLVSFIIPIYQPFRLLFVLPAFYILLAVGIPRLGRSWKLGLVGVFFISISGLLMYWTNPKFQREDWKMATKEVPSNAIFAWPIPFDPYIWYGGKGVGVVKHFPATKDDVTANLESLKGQKEIYLFEYLQVLSDPDKNIQLWLFENGYKLEKTLNYNGVGFVYKFKYD